MQVTDDEVYLVVNAGCREKDISHMQKHLDSFSVRIMLGECTSITWHLNMNIVTYVTTPLPDAVHQLADDVKCATGQVRAGRA